MGVKVAGIFLSITAGFSMMGASRLKLFDLFSSYSVVMQGGNKGINTAFTIVVLYGQ